MKFEDFLKNYDKPSFIVLLEGKRVVAEEDKEKLLKLSELLAVSTKNITFRSGNANGADDLFISGIASFDASRVELITPYSNHNKANNLGYKTNALDEIDLINEPEVVYHSKIRKKNTKIIEKYAQGEKNAVTINAAYLIRDTIKVIGTKSGIKAANFAIFYDDLSNPIKGGTGHTMQVCINNSIPFINQKIWFNWIEKK